MNKKGFTLMELLAVMAILAIIFLLTFPAVNSVINSGKETTYRSQINKILNAGRDYTLRHVRYLPDKGETKYISLGQLKSEGIIPATLINPNTKEYFKDDLVISIENTKDSSNGLYSIKDGDYLYTLNMDKISTTTPTITLKDMESGTDGNYVQLVNLNANYEEVFVRASSSDGNNALSVQKYILENNKVVSSIDTSKRTIYKIKYSTVDENGNAKSVTLNVIVGDNELPKIDFPENTVINTSVNSYDLEKDVTCTDNSGYCSFEYSGTINFGIVGKYTITYTASDLNGNSSTVKRIIEIK